MINSYGTQHPFLNDAMNHVKDDDQESACVVIIGHRTDGQDSDLENEDHKISNITGLPKEITGEVELFSIRKDEIERMTSGGNDINVELPPAKKQKQNAKKSKKNVK